jgi:hypothetical protein
MLRVWRLHVSLCYFNYLRIPDINIHTLEQNIEYLFQ